jgi:hypothetical protein
MAPRLFVFGVRIPVSTSTCALAEVDKSAEATKTVAVKRLECILTARLGDQYVVVALEHPQV